MHIDEDQWQERNVSFHETEVQSDEGGTISRRVSVPADATEVAVLVETLAGTAESSVDGVDADNVSRYSRVRLSVGKIREGAETIALSLRLGAGSAVRVVVAFFRRQAEDLRKNFSCRACKAACRFAVSAAMSVFGIPYLDAEELVEMPGPGEIDLTTRPPPSLEDILEGDWENPVLVDVGEPVDIRQQEGYGGLARFLESGDGPAWLAELFDRFHPDFRKLLRLALETVNWVFDATDRLYTTVCASLGACRPAAGEAAS